MGYLYEILDHYADFAWICVHEFPGLRTQEIEQKNQQGWSSPSFEISRLEINSTVLPEYNAQTWNPLAFLADLSASCNPNWTGTGPVCDKHGVSTSPGPHHDQSRSSCCSYRELGKFQQLKQKLVYILQLQMMWGFFISVVSLGQSCFAQGKPSPVSSVWYLGKHGCTGRTSICSPLPVPQCGRQRGEAHTETLSAAASLVWITTWHFMNNPFSTMTKAGFCCWLP